MMIVAMIMIATMIMIVAMVAVVAIITRAADLWRYGQGSCIAWSLNKSVCIIMADSGQT